MVEEALFRLPGVQDAAVVGAPDAHAGEVPVAYVVLRPGATASAQDVIDHAAKVVPERAAVPKHCYVLADMPKTLVGKIQKNLLRVDAIERMFRAALAATEAGRDAQVRAQDRGSRGFHVDIAIRQGDPTDPAIAAALRSFAISHTVRRIDEGASE